MKRIFSIVCVILLVLNVLGYYGLFFGLKYNNDLQQQQRLDIGDYNESETITIRIPMSIPYAVDSSEFRRVEGLFNHNGEYFRMIKQRLVRDTLEVVCFNDKVSQNIHKAFGDFTKAQADKSSDSGAAKTISSFIKDYLFHSFDIVPQAGGWVDVISPDNSSTLIVSHFFASIIHPPE